jgi:hypothetical protein
MRPAKCQRVKLLKWLAISDHNPNIRGSTSDGLSGSETHHLSPKPERLSAASPAQSSG